MRKQSACHGSAQWCQGDTRADEALRDAGAATLFRVSSGIDAHRRSEDCDDRHVPPSPGHVDNGGPKSEGLDLLTDVNWSVVVDNICVAGGFPQINIGDGGAGPNDAGGFGNVITYNYAVDAYYTDPPGGVHLGIMAANIGTNHSAHAQFNLVEGNYMGKFGSDGYHGSGLHTVLLLSRAPSGFRIVRP